MCDVNNLINLVKQDAFHSTKTSGNFKMLANVLNISMESY